MFVLKISNTARSKVIRFYFLPFNYSETKCASNLIVKNKYFVIKLFLLAENEAKLIFFFFKWTAIPRLTIWQRVYDVVKSARLATPVKLRKSFEILVSCASL